MGVFIQKTNRNSFSLRFKKYKNLRYDLWGRLALANKKNKITKYIRYFAHKDAMDRIKFLPWFKQKQIKFSLKLLKKHKPILYSSDASDYNLGKKTGRQKDPKLKRRSAIKNLKHTFRFFYGLSFRKKSLRKLLSMRKSQPTGMLELRLDTLLYRSNFFQSISQARKFIRHVHILTKKRTHKTLVFKSKRFRPHSQIAPFQMILLTPSLALKRKKILVNSILAGNKLHYCRFSHFLINFKLLVILLLRMPLASQIRYPFSNIPLTQFLGVAKYL